MFVVCGVHGIQGHSKEIKGVENTPSKVYVIIFARLQQQPLKCEKKVDPNYRSVNVMQHFCLTSERRQMLTPFFHIFIESSRTLPKKDPILKVAFS